jgi:uncharacterized protein YvpB
MKKLSLILTMVMGLLFSNYAKAQSNADYFVGKWKITVIGTPNGDASMYFKFEKKEGKLTGNISDSTGTAISTITSIEESGKSITAYFTTQGYDVNIQIEPLEGDADKVKGSLMGMFDATGVRLKETSK